MKQITIEMPLVAECAATECAYNMNRACHARAITIGDGMHAGCDTFLAGSSHTKESKRMAGIGACKVSHCQYNEDLECVTDSIRVGMIGDKVNCMTFTAR
jgi:hypothetical protein